MSDVTGIHRLRIAIEVQGRAGSENLVLDMSAAEEICRECEDELEALGEDLDGLYRAAGACGDDRPGLPRRPPGRVALHGDQG